MNNCTASENQITRRILLTACTTALAVAFTVSSLPQPAHADRVTPPPVPDEIQVPAGHTAFLVGHAVGTQNYICLPSGDGFAWTLFTPQATLFSDNDKQQVTTHFFGPNLNPIPPEQAGTIRAAWQHSRDTSTVWAKGLNSATVDPDAIPWVLLEVVGAQDEPTGSNTLTATKFIQRLNTTGGVAPTTGCSVSTDVGKKAFVPYTADYFFYKQAPGNDADDDNDN